MIYKDMQLLWAARTQHTVPIAVRVASFAGVKGMLVLLNDACELQVCYLGTDPPLTGVNASDGAKELDYEAMDEEHRALLKVIKQASTDSMVEPKEKITLRAQVSSQVSTGSGGHEGSDIYTESSPSKEDKPDDEVCVRDDRSGGLISVLVRLYIGYNGAADLENVSLTFNYSPAFRCSAGKTMVIPLLRGGVKTPTTITLRFRAVKNVLPADLNLLVLAAYVTPNNEPRTARLDTRLPLTLASRVVAPLKNCQVSDFEQSATVSCIPLFVSVLRCVYVLFRLTVRCFWLFARLSSPRPLSLFLFFSTCSPWTRTAVPPF
jgi:Bardet-Biedl syndrome 9 protein